MPAVGRCIINGNKWRYFNVLQALVWRPKPETLDPGSTLIQARAAGDPN
jgi:hypothetical protein